MHIPSLRAADAAPHSLKRASLLVTTTGRSSRRWLVRTSARNDHQASVVTTDRLDARSYPVSLHALIVHMAIDAASDTSVGSSGRPSDNPALVLLPGSLLERGPRRRDRGPRCSASLRVLPRAYHGGHCNEGTIVRSDPTWGAVPPTVLTVSCRGQAGRLGSRHGMPRHRGVTVGVGSERGSVSRHVLTCVRRVSSHGGDHHDLATCTTNDVYTTRRDRHRASGRGASVRSFGSVSRRAVTTIAAAKGLPEMNTKGLAPMAQRHPVCTRLRDVWDAAMADHTIDDREADTITVLIEDIDDGTRYALSVLKGGASTRRAYDGLREFETLHGPIDLEQHIQKRRHGDNHDDAA